MVYVRVGCDAVSLEIKYEFSVDSWCPNVVFYHEFRDIFSFFFFLWTFFYYAKIVVLLGFTLLYSPIQSMGCVKVYSFQ